MKVDFKNPSVVSAGAYRYPIIGSDRYDWIQNVGTSPREVYDLLHRGHENLGRSPFEGNWILHRKAINGLPAKEIFGKFQYLWKTFVVRDKRYYDINGKEV